MAFQGAHPHVITVFIDYTQRSLKTQIYNNKVESMQKRSLTDEVVYRPNICYTDLKWELPANCEEYAPPTIHMLWVFPLIKSLWIRVISLSSELFQVSFKFQQVCCMYCRKYLIIQYNETKRKLQPRLINIHLNTDVFTFMNHKGVTRGIFMCRFRLIVPEGFNWHVVRKSKSQHNNKREHNSLSFPKKTFKILKIMLSACNPFH